MGTFLRDEDLRSVYMRENKNTNQYKIKKIPNMLGSEPIGIIPHFCFNLSQFDTLNKTAIA